MISQIICLAAGSISTGDDAPLKSSPAGDHTESPILRPAPGIWRWPCKKKMPDAEIVGVDFLPEMLDLARRKGVRQIVLADAMNLPFGDASFDCVTIAFGLRNLENWAAALAQMSRVLKTNGHVLVLEFSLPTTPILRAIYRFYLHRCLPLFGSFLTGTKTAYDYLGDSIEEFPSGGAMCELMAENGFTPPTFQPLTGGIVTIYAAEKL